MSDAIIGTGILLKAGDGGTSVYIESDALAADLLISGLTIQVLDYAQLATDNAIVTVVIDGQPHYLEEGVHWTAATTDEATATSLAAAIHALDLITAAAATDTVTVTVTDPDVFATIAEIVTLKPPQKSRNEIDVSNHNEGEEAKILGMLRKGQVTGTLNWLPTDATHVQLDTDINANVKRNWRITLPPSGLPYFTFPARVQLLDPQEVGVDAPLQIAFALTIDGWIQRQTA